MVKLFEHVDKVTEGDTYEAAMEMIENGYGTVQIIPVDAAEG